MSKTLRRMTSTTSSSLSMMTTTIVCLCAIIISMISDGASGFRFVANQHCRCILRSPSSSSSAIRMSSTTTTETPLDGVEAIRSEPQYDSLVVSGFISKANNFAETFVFEKLYAKGKWSEITTVTDDLKFARKRFVNPKTVYSGLIDVLKFSEVVDGTTNSLESALAGKEAWLGFNMTTAELPQHAKLAAKLGLKRVVFAVHVKPEESGEGVTFDDVRATLTAAKVDYTIVKFGTVTEMDEAKFPYRIVRDVLPLPTEGELLSSQDLMRVVVEIVDLPKSFNNVYGIGPGTRMDAEISVYMKSQGWPERVQVGLLVGDMMEKIEKRWELEQKKKAEKEANKGSSAAPKVNDLSIPKDGNKMAGFFT